MSSWSQPLPVIQLLYPYFLLLFLPMLPPMNFSILLSTTINFYVIPLVYLIVVSFFTHTTALARTKRISTPLCNPLGSVRCDLQFFFMFRFVISMSHLLYFSFCLFSFPFHSHSQLLILHFVDCYTFVGL